MTREPQMLGLLLELKKHYRAHFYRSIAMIKKGHSIEDKDSNA